MPQLYRTPVADALPNDRPRSGTTGGGALRTAGDLPRGGGSRIAAGTRGAVLLLSRKRTGIGDPFRREKDLSTALALRLLPELKELVGSGEGAFERALLLAIGGNIIDYGATPDFNIETAERQIRQVLNSRFDAERAADLHRRMDAA
ncbi:MAG: DUF89 family protein, partial [Lentisphaeria bacterium]|nr:DUF89 family protein [Lentisphaeria bacterium]